MPTNDLPNQPGFPEERILKESRWKNIHPWPFSIVIVSFLLGLLSGYVTWGWPQPASVGASGDQGLKTNANTNMDSLIKQVNPSDGYNLGVSYSDLGSQVIAAGGIDYPAFVDLYKSTGRPLTEDQIEILTQKTDRPIIINAENAHFLLNFFWAIGLVNTNPILTEGPITQYSQGQVERFASTGGWTLGTKPVTELFASQKLITLTPEQQARVEEAATLIYRPCCNNPTLFPDCNHGMAMLGLLELMASQGATSDEMLQAAKYVNAFWFPQQAVEMAMFLEAANSTSFHDADPALIVGKEMSSSSGFAAVHQYLQTNGLLVQTPGRSSSCTN